MKKVILMRGLPGSGKTHYAKKLQEENRSQYKRVSKDELRSMMDDGRWSRDNEDFILKIRDILILEILNHGKNVIVDDTNLAPKHEARIKQIVGDMAEVVIQDFTDVPIDTCIKRDLQRPHAVGEKVIRRMYNQFLSPQNIDVQDQSLPPAILVDLDGTLALFDKKNPYERDFTLDMVNESVKSIIVHFQIGGYKIILVSGRKNKFLGQTERWLKDNMIVYDALFMPREDVDSRKDTIIKREIYDTHIRGKYYVHFVIDDRLSVCRLWYSLGLTLFKVGNPDAEF